MAELHDGGHFGDGEVGDGAEVAALKLAGGGVEGGVRQGAEGRGLRVQGDGMATHGIRLRKRCGRRERRSG